MGCSNRPGGLFVIAPKVGFGGGLAFPKMEFRRKNIVDQFSNIEKTLGNINNPSPTTQKVLTERAVKPKKVKIHTQIAEDTANADSIRAL